MPQSLLGVVGLRLVGRSVIGLFSFYCLLIILLSGCLTTVIPSLPHSLRPKRQNCEVNDNPIGFLCRLISGLYLA